MKIKVCGIRDLATARVACEYGVDILGFVFAKSKRQVSMDEAYAMTRKLPSHVQTVGIFVNEESSIVKKVVEKCGITYAQLHGEESISYCDSLKLPVIKAFSIASEDDVQQSEKYNVAYRLFDSAKGAYYGGNGTTFDWTLLKNAPKDNLMLAGGLNSSNIEEAIRIVRPAAIDVSSGVETNGVKDREKIRAFIEKVRGVSIC